MILKIKHYNDLSKDELYRILQIQALVFVVEQNCPYQDLDDLDQNAYHIMLHDENKLLKAYCRIIPPLKSFIKECVSATVLNEIQYQ